MKKTPDEIVDELFNDIAESPPLLLHFDQQDDGEGGYRWTVTAKTPKTTALLATVPAREGSPGILIAIGQHILSEFRNAVVEVSGFDENECRHIGRNLRPR